MTNFNQNNLDKALSPYLRQHKDNPIHWQEWSGEVLEHAKKNNKIILASVGYATCHWCHVMAREDFSNKEIAQFLNQHFVCIKVDREQRPDIDHYLMNFCQETQGHGGWPLNVFLTADQKPFFAVTYVPITPEYELPGFFDLLQYVKQSYNQQAGHIPTYAPHIHQQERQENIAEQDLIAEIKANKSHFTGEGFSQGPQFPPHNMLLFLLSWYEQHKDSEIKDILEKILDKMAKGGLHDHLQGGFYRYCIDESWTIPHFEKMLYDQAMHLWVYSAAYKLFSRPQDKVVIEKLLSCLGETFLGEGLYYSAHDADTNHHEGETYLWTKEELQQGLSEEEFSQFSSLYVLEEQVEGKIHLLKRKNTFLPGIPGIEKKLLDIRNRREQPGIDQKYVTSWNALLGISLLMAYRALGDAALRQRARTLFQTLAQHDYKENEENKEKLAHSSIEGKRQHGEFLEDYAAMLLLATYLYEDGGVAEDEVREWKTRLLRFKQKAWIESITDDFASLPAAVFDHPVPSSSSLAEMALLRAQIILGEEYSPGRFTRAGASDFFNMHVLIRNGGWHIIHSPQAIDWEELPLNCLQIRAAAIQDCFHGSCREFQDIHSLLQALHVER